MDGCKKLNGHMRASLSKVAEAHKLARLTCDKEVVAMYHVPSQRFGAATVVPPPGSFL